MASAIAYTADETMAEAPTHGPAGPSPAAQAAAQALAAFAPAAAAEAAAAPSRGEPPAEVLTPAPPPRFSPTAPIPPRVAASSTALRHAIAKT